MLRAGRLPESNYFSDSLDPKNLRFQPILSTNLRHHVTSLTLLLKRTRFCVVLIARLAINVQNQLRGKRTSVQVLGNSDNAARDCLTTKNFSRSERSWIGLDSTLLSRNGFNQNSAAPRNLKNKVGRKSRNASTRSLRLQPAVEKP